MAVGLVADEYTVPAGTAAMEQTPFRLFNPAPSNDDHNSTPPQSPSAPSPDNNNGSDSDDDDDDDDDEFDPDDTSTIPRPRNLSRGRLQHAMRLDGSRTARYYYNKIRVGVLVVSLCMLTSLNFRLSFGSKWLGMNGWSGKICRITKRRSYSKK